MVLSTIKVFLTWRCFALKNLGRSVLPEIAFHYVKFPYAGMGFGLGVQVIKNRASLSVLGSDGEYVGGGAYRTEFWVDPKEDITGIILVQLREPQYNLRFHDTIKTLIYQALR